MQIILIILTFLLTFSSCDFNSKKSEETEEISYRLLWTGPEFGYVDNHGDTIIPLGIYSHLGVMNEEGMILATKDNKKGFIDIHQNILIPFDYDDLSSFSHGLVRAKKDGKYGFIDRNGTIVIPLEYDEVDSFSNSLTSAKKDGKFGFINTTGEVIIPFIYDERSTFRASGLAVARQGDKYGFINTKGEEIIPIVFDKAKQSDLDTIVLVLKNNKWAFFSNNGTQLSEFKFDEILPAFKSTSDFHRNVGAFFDNGLALVKNNGQFAFINTKMEIIVPFGKYNHASSFNHYRLAIVRKGMKYGVIDENGKIVIEFDYDHIEHPHIYSQVGDIFVLRKNNLYQVLDKNTRQITDLNIKNWEYGSPFMTSRPYLILTNTANKVGFISWSGELIVPFEYSYVARFDGKSTTMAKKEDKYGLIDFNHNIILPFEFDYIETSRFFSYFTVTHGDKMGVFDKNGEIIIPFVYDHIEPCHYDNDNRYIVKQGDNYGIIDKSGSIIIPLEFEKITNWVEYGPQAHYVRKSGKTGLISREGEVLIPVIYDNLFFTPTGFVFAGYYGKQGVLDLNNQQIIPFEYDIITPSSFFPYGIEYEKFEFFVNKGNKYFAINTKNEITRQDLTANERERMTENFNINNIWDALKTK